MALRAFSSRLPTAHYHSGIGLAKVRCTQRRLTIPPSRFFSAEAVSSPSNLVQVYISRSTDPYLNLSIEHFLLQKSHPDSVVLLLYTNRPCIVIGRNQNPWVEVNLGLVEDSGADADDDVLLVRRRSGGGTVFHDAGNVNYSVICPPASFDRNKHAEMVVRALQGLRKENVRVNERHDIVLDVASTINSSASDASRDSHTGDDIKTFKISGSAYKLTRTRSLHHGTCLLSSPHLLFLGQLLRSPAAPYIKARGVESVRSPVRNVGVSNAEFENAVVAEFLKMYEDAARDQQHEKNNGQTSQVDVEILDAAAVRDIPEVRAGVAELRSRDWVYAQTPQFTFSSHPTADDPRPRPDLPTDFPDVAKTAGSNNLIDSLKSLHLHHVDDWRTYVGSENESVGRWLNRLFGASS
ncbi:hypothetical protein F4782DRAFT_541478 [Xylaria castorea]|nr:hypothetical protein F4782DRAFT_541478 [Xylaria castorea]